MIQAKIVPAILVGILCGLSSVLFGQQGAAVSGTAPQPTLAGTLLGVQPQRYTMKNQDVLVISFPSTPEFDQTVMVQPDGYINLTSGTLHVQGETVPEVIVSIKRAYSTILREPFYVGVDVKDSQKPLFTVLGQVARPGQYVLRTNTTLAEALSVAGGLTATSKTQLLLYHKESDAWFRVEKFNLKDILHGRSLKQDVLVRPGDMIFVPEKFIANFRKYVPYALTAATYSQQSSY